MSFLVVGIVGDSSSDGGCSVANVRYKAKHLAAAVWAPPFWRHHLDAHRLGMKTFQYREQGHDITVNRVRKVRMI